MLRRLWKKFDELFDTFDDVFDRIDDEFDRLDAKFDQDEESAGAPVCETITEVETKPDGTVIRRTKTTKRYTVTKKG